MVDIEMTWWKKALVVALAAVVGVFPAFVQLGHAQRVPESVFVLPAGEELPDEEMLEIEGEALWLKWL
jgi:hypothetical protein